MKTLISALLLLFSINLYSQNDDALIKSAYTGDLAAAKQLVEAGANVNYKNAAGQTPLSLAYLFPEITELLLSKGADANGGDYPALVAASRYYSVDVIKMLLKAGADPNKIAVIKVDLAAGVRKALEDEKAKGKKGNKYLVKAYEDQLKAMGNATTITYSALQNAVGNTNCKECVELLLGAGAKTDFKSSITGGNIVHEIAFTWVPVEQRAAAIQTSIPYYEQAGMAIPEWYKKLDITSMGNANDIVRMLKDKGANMEGLDNNKWTPLMWAVRQPTPNEEIIDALVASGADMKATGLNNDPTEFVKETADPEKIKVRFDFPREGRSSNGSGYSANMELLNPKPKRVALISYYLYDPGKGKVTGNAQSAMVSASVWRTPDGIGKFKSMGSIKRASTH